MKEPVDKLLTGRIRQVFEDFEDPSADAGWTALRKKYPAGNRSPLILWLSSAAAMLMVTAGLWFIRPTEQLTVLKPAERVKPVKTRKENALSTESEKNIQTVEKPLSIAEAERPVRGIVVPGSQKLPEASEKGNSLAVSAGKEKTVISEVTVDRGTVKNSSGQAPAEQAFAENSKPVERSTLEKKAANPAVVQLPEVNLPENILAQVARDEKLLGAASPPIKEPVSAAGAKDPVKESVKAKEFSPRPLDRLAKSDPIKSKKAKMDFSVYAGSYFNYSEGSENQLNFGAGIMSDIRLSKNLKISTGVSIASNTLDYSNGQDVPANAASSFLSIGDYSTTGNLTTITSYQASLLALDIPVNIKYQFVPESDKFYVSAGLSSGTYLNETYLYEYRNFNTASGNYISQTEDQKTKKQFNDFDLGRTLNLSLGISTGFGKTQTISIEPFLKYPLGGLGSENLRFGSTGINLKLRFNP